MRVRPKKSVFTALNYYLPTKGVMPMHCSVNTSEKDDAAIFFGLSGTGKTTLSADASRILIGDDEHGWSENGLFNFEGGCYAKMIKLSPEAEPENLRDHQTMGYRARKRRDGTRSHATSISTMARSAENSRRRPIRSRRSRTRRNRAAAASRKTWSCLTADAFGVMPPIAKLTPAQAMYHFLSGLYRQGRRHRKGRHGADRHFLHLLWRAVHATPSVRVR